MKSRKRLDKHQEICGEALVKITFFQGGSMMSSVSKGSKNRLNSIINAMSESTKDFVRNPKKDFTRKRKLSMETTIKIVLAMGGNSLSAELLEYFQYNDQTATSSAFIQARHKLLPSAFETIFQRFTLPTKHINKYRDYRILAHDGSDVNLPPNPDDIATYQGNGVNLLHLNAFYDVMNKIYLNADLQGKCETDERASLVGMIRNVHFPDKTIVLGDRGYESCNVFEHLKNRGLKFVIRAKDVNSNGILAKLELPKTDEFDTDVKFWFSRQQTNDVKANPHIKFLSTSSKFDFLPPKSKGTYEMNFRVVRVKLSENSYETLITNLCEIEFPPDSLKELYHMRWGVETSFRELKYALGLCHFHAKTKDFIEQEIFAKLIMYNFCMMIACKIVLRKKRTKWGYQVNFTRAIEICRHFFRFPGRSSSYVETLIEKHVLPVRENRANKRNLKPKSFVAFVYRVA